MSSDLFAYVDELATERTKNIFLVDNENIIVSIALNDASQDKNKTIISSSNIRLLILKSTEDFFEIPLNSIDSIFYEVGKITSSFKMKINNKFIVKLKTVRAGKEREYNFLEHIQESINNNIYGDDYPIFYDELLKLQKNIGKNNMDLIKATVADLNRFGKEKIRADEKYALILEKEIIKEKNSKYKEKVIENARTSDVYLGSQVKDKWLIELEEREILKTGELMKAIISGSIESSWGWGDVETDKTRHSRTAIARNGALICTDQRLIFYMPKILGRWEIETASLEQVSSIQYTKGLISGRLHITVFNDEKVIKWVNNEEGKAMADIIEKQIDDIRSQQRFASKSVAVGSDPLEVLKLRFVQGEISEEEYLRMKKLLE